MKDMISRNIITVLGFTSIPVIIVCFQFQKCLMFVYKKMEKFCYHGDMNRRWSKNGVFKEDNDISPGI